MTQSQIWTHDPDAVLDYTFDWTGWLAASETITAHTVTATTGVTLGAHGVTGGKVTVWVNSVTSGTTTGKITCHIVTSQGRTDERSRTLRIVNR